MNLDYQPIQSLKDLGENPKRRYSKYELYRPKV